MGLDIRVRQNLILRSGALYDLGDIACPAEWLTQRLHYQKEAYMLADYATQHLTRVPCVYHESTDPDDYIGDFVLTAEAVTDILNRASKAVKLEHTNNKAQLKELFPMGKCMQGHYDGYDVSFFDDLRKVLTTLPTAMEYAVDSDVRLILSID